MNHGTKTIELPELTANLLRDKDCLIDNLFADLWKHMGMKARLNRSAFPSAPARRRMSWCTADDLGLVESGLDWHVCAGVIEDLLLCRERCPVCGFESGRLELASSA